MIVSLLKHKPYSNSELANAIGVSYSTISQHLAELTQADIVRLVDFSYNSYGRLRREHKYRITTIAKAKVLKN